MKHPATRVAWRYYAFAFVFAAIGGLLAASGVLPGGVGFVALGGIFVWFGTLFGRNVESARAVNAAIDALAHQRLDEARSLLARVHDPRPYIARGMNLVHARIALTEGDPKAAIDFATRAAEGPTRVLTRSMEHIQISSALSTRALAYALAGEDDAALIDAAKASAAKDALPDTYARATLARCVVAARKDDRAAIARAWTEDKRLMLEQLPPRERLLARALSRLARAQKKSVYREPARPVDVDPTRAWAERFVPEAAPFMDRTREATTLAIEDAAPTAEAVKSVGKARSVAKVHAFNRRQLTLVVVLFALLVPIFYAFLAATPPNDLGSFDLQPLAFLNVLVPILVALFLGVFARNILLIRWQHTRLRRALLSMLRGNEVDDDLRKLTKTRIGTVAAEAELILADVQERRGSFQDAIASCDRAIARCTQTEAWKALTHDVHLPLAISERAFCLAAVGRVEESDAELANLRTFTSFGYMARSVFRIRLARALARKDTKTALDIARSRTIDMPLSHRDELLCDLVEAVEGSGVDEDEWARIDSELADDPKLAAWIEHFLPGARARLSPRKRVVDAEEEAALEESLATQTA